MNCSPLPLPDDPFQAVFAERTSTGPTFSAPITPLMSVPSMRSMPFMLPAQPQPGGMCTPPGVQLQPAPATFTAALMAMPQPVSPYVFMAGSHAAAPVAPNGANAVFAINGASQKSGNANGNANVNANGNANANSNNSNSAHNGNATGVVGGIASLQARNAALEQEVADLRQQVERLQRQRAADAAHWESYHNEQQGRLGAMSLLLERERQAAAQVFALGVGGLVRQDTTPQGAGIVSPLTHFELPTMVEPTGTYNVLSSSGGPYNVIFTPPAAPPLQHKQRSEGSGEEAPGTPCSHSLSMSAAAATENGEPVPSVLETLYGPARVLLSLPLSTSAEFYDFYVSLRQVEQRTGFLTAAVRAALLARCLLEEIDAPKDGYWALMQQDASQWRLERYYFVHKCLRFLPALKSITITQCKYFPLRVNADKVLEENWFRSVEEVAVLGTWWKAEEITELCQAFERRKPGQLRVLRLSKSYGPKGKDLDVLNQECGGKLEYV